MKQAAEVCRERGWKAGDLLEGPDLDGKRRRVLLTAVGRDFVMAADASGKEDMWCLDFSTWERLPLPKVTVRIPVEVYADGSWHVRTCCSPEFQTDYVKRRHSVEVTAELPLPTALVKVRGEVSA